MITIINNVKKLSENPKELIDANAIINEQIEEIIKEVSLKIKRLNLKHKAIVTINGDSNNLSFDIDSKDSETEKSIESLLKSI